jgi:hypothetical protein
MKPCSRCLNPAKLSYYVLLSTIGVRPRVQESSKSVLLCNSCFESLLASLADSQPQLFEQFSSSSSAAAGCPRANLTYTLSQSKENS